MGILSWINQLEFVGKEIKEIPGLADTKPGKTDSLKGFISRAPYVIKLILLEKEIVTFAVLQWLSIALGCYLCVQISEDWLSVNDIVLFLCIGVSAFLLGIFSGCMGVAYLLHKQGKDSTIVACLRIVLPRAWSLWILHWIDSWITVSQIRERLTNKETPAQRVSSEALYYAWKLGTMGVLPALLTGHGLVDSGKHAVIVVKEKLKEMAVLRIGYSLICWIIGIGAYVVLLLAAFKGNEISFLTFFVPVLIAVGIIHIFRPIYLISACDIYYEYMKEREEPIVLTDNPSKGVSVLIAFFVLCIMTAVAYLYRQELGF